MIPVIFIFAVLIIRYPFGITANNLIYDAEEKNGWFADTSATRVIIFAVRISFLLRSQWDVDRQPYSWKRQPRFDCALFSVPVPYYVSGGFLFLVVFIVFIITFCFYFWCKGTNIFGNHQTKNQKSLFI